MERRYVPKLIKRLRLHTRPFTCYRRVPIPKPPKCPSDEPGPLCLPCGASTPELFGVSLNSRAVERTGGADPRNGATGCAQTAAFHRVLRHSGNIRIPRCPAKWCASGLRTRAPRLERRILGVTAAFGYTASTPNSSHFPSVAVVGLPSLGGCPPPLGPEPGPIEHRRLRGNGHTEGSGWASHKCQGCCGCKPSPSVPVPSHPHPGSVHRSTIRRPTEGCRQQQRVGMGRGVPRTVLRKIFTATR